MSDSWSNSSNISSEATTDCEEDIDPTEFEGEATDDPCQSNADRASDDEQAVGLLCIDDPPADETFVQEYRAACAERDTWSKRYPIDSKGRWTSQNGNHFLYLMKYIFQLNLLHSMKYLKNRRQILCCSDHCQT